jgi:serine/threonine protein kinase
MQVRGAAVYRARHQALQRDVALKILAPWLTDTPDFVKRFRQEGQILARLAHPHIVTVHDAGSAQGYYYLAMELVRRITFPLSAFARCTFCTSMLYYQGLWTGPACFRI